MLPSADNTQYGIICQDSAAQSIHFVWFLLH